MLISLAGDELIIQENLTDFVRERDFNLFGKIDLLESEIVLGPQPDISFKQIEVRVHFVDLVHIHKIAEFLMKEIDDRLGNVNFAIMDEITNIFLLVVFHDSFQLWFCAFGDLRKR